MPWPGFEPGFLHPQRRILTTIRSRLKHPVVARPINTKKALLRTAKYLMATRDFRVSGRTQCFEHFFTAQICPVSNRIFHETFKTRLEIYLAPKFSNLWLFKIGKKSGLKRKLLKTFTNERVKIPTLRSLKHFGFRFVIRWSHLTALFKTTGLESHMLGLWSNW